MNTYLKNEDHGSRTTLWASLGSVIEYYDFVIYGMMAKYLGEVFFSPSNHQNIQALLIFAVGYLARPFGGMLAGIIGDRFGRKPAFLISTSLMACSTFIIGCLPGYKVLGDVSSYLLAFLRLVQGLSFGGEFPGATTLVGEFATSKNQGWRCSLIVASTSIGALLATALLSRLTLSLSDFEIINWGWRIPFLIGGSAGFILFVMRWNILESPYFVQENRVSPNLSPLVNLTKNYYHLILKAIGLTIFPAGMVITNLYYPYYLSTYFNYKLSDVYSSITLSLIFSAIIVPVIGKFSDFISKKKLILVTCLAYIILSFPLFYLLQSQQSIFLIIFLIIHQFFLALFYAAYLPTIVNIFPAAVRYSGIGASYNLTYAFMALLPTLLTYLLGRFQNLWVMPIILASITAIPLIVIRRISIYQNET